MKVGSQFDTIEVGIPFSFKIWSMNICTTIATVKGCINEQKLAYLESLSTTTMITNLVLSFLNPTMKSIEMFLQIETGMGRGWTFLGGLINYSLLRVGQSWSCHWYQSMMTMVKVKEAPRWVQQAQKWKIMDWHRPHGMQKELKQVLWYNNMGRLGIATNSLERYK